jgi:hypothetical protein
MNLEEVKDAIGKQPALFAELLDPYRMQLFLYLKASGREELNTMNLWAGMDAA